MNLFAQYLFFEQCMLEDKVESHAESIGQFKKWLSDEKFDTWRNSIFTVEEIKQQKDHKNVIFLAGVEGQNAICWRFDADKRQIWLANSLDCYLEIHPKLENEDLWNTVCIWNLPEDEFPIICESILQSASLPIDQIYKQLQDRILSSYLLSGSNNGTLGIDKWKIHDGKFYSSHQIAKKGTFHAMMWMLFVCMNMEHDLAKIFAQQTFEEIRPGLSDLFLSSRNHLRLIYSACKNIYKLEDSDIDKLLCNYDYKKEEEESVQCEEQTSSFDGLIKLQHLSKQFSVAHIESLISLDAYFMTDREFLGAHIASMTIENMRLVLEESYQSHTDWVSMLHKMTACLQQGSKVFSQTRYEESRQYLSTEYVKFQFQPGFSALLVQLAVRMFQINETYIAARLPIKKGKKFLWPRLNYSSRVELGDVNILDSYAGHLFDPRDKNKQYETHLEKEDTNTVFAEFWNIDMTKPFPEHMKRFCKFVQTSKVTVFLMTAYSLLMHVPFDRKYKDYRISIEEDVFHIQHTPFSWSGDGFNQCTDGFKSETARFDDMYLSTHFVQGQFHLNDLIKNKDDFSRYKDILYETCDAKSADVVISSNWYINYKIQGRWLEKRKEIERVVYMDIAPQVETCNESAFLFYVVKILQHDLTDPFKVSLCKLLRLRRDPNLQDVIRVVCAILSNESLNASKFRESLGITEDPMTMTLQACVLMYLRTCNETNYNACLNSLINTNIFADIPSTVDMSELESVKVHEKVFQYQRKKDKAFLMKNPTNSKLKEISELLDKAIITYVVWKLDDKTVILDVPNFDCSFKWVNKKVLLTNKTNGKIFTIQWTEIPCSMRDWGLEAPMVSFFTKNEDGAWGVVLMCSAIPRVEMARTMFDWDENIKETIRLPSKILYLQFSANLCIPIFDENVYFVGAMCIAAGNVRCIHALYHRLAHAKLKSTDPFEEFVAKAILNKCIGTPFFSLLFRDEAEIKRRRLYDVQPVNVDFGDIGQENPVDDLLVITESSTSYPNIGIPSLAVNTDKFKGLLDSYLKKLNDETFLQCVEFLPNYKVAWVVSSLQVFDKARELSEKFERFGLVKHLHKYFVDPPVQDEFMAICGKFVTKEQRTFLNDMEEGIKTQSVIYQAIMGIGKSSVIMPILVHNALKRKINVVVIQPQHLVKAALSVLLSFVPYSTNKQAKVIENFKEAGDAWVAVLSDGEMKEIVLQAHLSSDQEVLRKINEALVLMDEVDEMSNPLRSEFNIPGGTRILHPMEIQDMHSYYEKMYDSSAISSTDPLDAKIKEDANVCAQLRMNMDYGASPTGQFAIPYKGVNAPILGSSFSDPEIKHILTCLVKKEQGLSLGDIRQFRNSILIYKPMGDDFVDEFLRKISDRFNTIPFPFKYMLRSTHKAIHQDFRRDKELIRHHLISVLLPSSSFQATQNNIAFMDLIEAGTCKQKIGFSGTTNMFDPPFTEEWDFQPKIIASDKAKAQISQTLEKYLVVIQDPLKFFDEYDVVVDEAGLLRLFSFQEIKDKTAKTLVYFDESDQKQELAQKKVYYVRAAEEAPAGLTKTTVDKEEDFLALFDKYDVIVDPENKFSHISSFSIAQKTKKILVYLGKEATFYYKKKSDCATITTLVNQTEKEFFDLFTTFDVVIDETKQWDKVSLEELDKNGLARLGKEEKVYYFDQKHTTGTDLALPSLAKGIVLINLKLSILSKVAQAAFRLRNVNMGQTVVYAAEETLPGNQTLYNLLNQNETGQNAAREVKHWRHAILVQYRKEQNYKKEAYEMALPYALKPPEEITITEHSDWNAKFQDAQKKVQKPGPKELDQQMEQQMEQQLEQQLRQEIAHLESKKTTWTYKVKSDFTIQKYTDINSVQMPRSVNACFSTFNHILISPYVLKMLSEGLPVPRYLLVFTEEDDEWCRILTPGEALTLPIGCTILNNQGISINNKDVQKRTELVLIAMILCGYQCPLIEQIHACRNMEKNGLREIMKCIINKLFVNQNIDLTFVLKQYILSDTPYDDIITQVRENTKTNEAFGKFILGVQIQGDWINYYREQTIHSLSAVYGEDFKLYKKKKKTYNVWKGAAVAGGLVSLAAVAHALRKKRKLKKQ
jgi:hypothetical protein